MESSSEDNVDNKIKFPGSLKKQPFFQSLRLQLVEQLKSLDVRLESQLGLTGELQDYFKRKAEVEADISKMMDKMFKQVQTRGRGGIMGGAIALAGANSGGGINIIGRRSTGSGNVESGGEMLSGVLLHLMNETRKEAKERSVLSEICIQIVTRLGIVADDLARVYKQCREVCREGQDELLKVLYELHASSKSYGSYRVEWKQAEGKLKIVEGQKNKLENTGAAKSKKYKVVEKEVTKRLRKSNDSRFKCLKSKNEYLLCLDAANAALQKYFVDDLSDLIDCMDLGYYSSVWNGLKLYISSEEVKKDSISNNILTLEKLLSSLDSRVDKQKFLEANNSHFVLPKKFTVVTFEDEEEGCSNLSTESFMREELEQRLLALERRLSTLRMESNELWKTLETAETSLLALIALGDNSKVVRDWFVGNSTKDIHNTFTNKMRNDRIETDVFHINKYRDYMLVTNRISRLQSKYEHIRSTLGIISASPTMTTTSASPIGAESSQGVRRKRIGQNKFQKQNNNCGVKLFGGSIEEYLEFNKNDDIPIVIKAAVRVINLYGLHHQGIFRVSGSQLEINNFKDAFERGEDPLCEMTDASDMNSVASLLKLYLRELREPLFPIVFFDIFMEIAQLDNPAQFSARLKELVTKSLPRPVFVVLRYLFHFLNHLSEYSDENMMDPYNLAICFGPTLVPVPEDKDQVQFQNLVNELIKNVIVYAHDIFINDGANEVYEKFNSQQQEEPPPEEALVAKEDRKNEDDLDPLPLDLPIFNEQSEQMEAIAQYDFKARSGRELSFKKGQTLVLFSQVSSDWWKGAKKDTDAQGLVPDKYILIKIREEDALTPAAPPPSCASPKLEEKKQPRTRTVSETLIPSKSLVTVHQRSLSEEVAGPSCAAVVAMTTTSSNRVSDTPDLVMDLPAAGDSDESSSGAEVFAKQNQCTLKKGMVKQVGKVKPQVMAKPKLPFKQQHDKDSISD